MIEKKVEIGHDNTIDTDSILFDCQRNRIACKSHCCLAEMLGKFGQDFRPV